MYKFKDEFSKNLSIEEVIEIPDTDMVVVYFKHPSGLLDNKTMFKNDLEIIVDAKDLLVKFTNAQVILEYNRCFIKDMTIDEHNLEYLDTFLFKNNLNFEDLIIRHSNFTFKDKDSMLCFFRNLKSVYLQISDCRFLYGAEDSFSIDELYDNSNWGATLIDFTDNFINKI